MHASNCRREIQFLTLARQALWAGLAILASIWAVPAFGQDSSPVTTDDGGFLFSDRFTGRRGEAYGAVFRLGVETGPAIGREDTLIPLEFMPYGFLFDEAMIFGDLRGFRSTKDHWGANLGGGYRHYISAWDRIVGVNGYFDYDNTSGGLFRQFGGGIETYGKFWDARVNAYFPTGTTNKQLDISVVPNSAKFITNYLYFDQQRIIGNALRGVDMEVGVPLLGDFLTDHDVRLFAGWYHYENDETISTWGWKGRLQGDVTPSASLALEVTHDKVFDTNVIFGASWSYGGYRQPDDEPKSTFDRMTTRVRRNYNVVVSRDTIIDTNIIAINPTTQAPYFFEHVASYAPAGGNGTVENPFQTIAEAQAQASGDIIFVHANSVYDGGADSAVVLEEGVRVLGEGDGVRHFVTVSGLGSIELPRAEPNLPNRPTFLSSPGNAVTLANNAEFSGFIIGDPTDPLSGPLGHGIFGDAVGGVTIRQTDVNYAALDGIHLENTIGQIQMRGDRIFNSTETGLNVQGGSGNILFVDDASSGVQGVIDKTGGTGYGLRVAGTSPGLASSVVMVDGGTTQADINTSGVQGILIDNAGGSVIVGNTNIAGSPQNAIEVLSGAGNVTFGGTVNVSNSSTAGTGDSSAILITDKPVGTTVLFAQPVNITSRNERGFGYFNNASSLAFRDTLTINATTTSSSILPALEYQNNSGTARFEDISINGSSVEGILIGTPLLASNNSGSFIVTGTTSITNADTGVLIEDDDATVQFNGLSITGYGTDAIVVRNNRSLVSFLGNTLIDGTANTLVREPAILIHDNTGDISFQTVAISNVTGSSSQTLPDPNGPNANIAYASGVTIFDNPSSVNFSSLSVDTVFGAGLLAFNVGTTTTDFTTNLVTGTGGLTIGGGAFTATTNANTESAINIQESVMNVTLNSVDVFSYTSAINLINNVGVGTPTVTTNGSFPTSMPAAFTITGASGVPLSGGIMSGGFASNIFVRNSGDISLSNIESSLSLNSGIDVANTRSLFVFNSQFTGNLDHGLVAADVPLIAIDSSTFNNNGSTAGPNNEIRLTGSISSTTLDDTYTRINATQILGYNWAITNNVIVDGAGDNTDEVIFISGNNNASPLTLVVDSNAISSSESGSTDLELVWAGPLQASFTRNIFNTTGGLSTGLDIRAQANNSTSDIEILSNQFGGSIGGNTGLNVVTSGVSSVLVGSYANTGVGNIFNLNGTLGTGNTVVNNVGMQFNFAPNTFASIYDNQVTMNGDGDTAIDVIFASGPGTTLAVNNNLINMNGQNGGALEEGIVIESVIGTVNLFGTQNNIINFNNSNFFNTYRFPPTGINGTIIINGAAVP